LNRLGDTEPRQLEDARRRAAVELIARYESALRKTAQRYSLDAGDAEDAYQRALEIVLTKAPTTDPNELIRWTQTVTKHEALAVRRSRERLLGPRRPEWLEGPAVDPLASLPSRVEGPDEQVERREDVARSREALRRLKPAELRALGLLAEGYSYAEIGRLTGYSQTKVNRVLAEGRSRFRDFVSRSEDGRRCRELRPLLSTFCDGEASMADAEIVREHLRACASCRSTMRAYRAAPRLAGALVPALLPSRSLLGRVHDLLTRVGSQVSGTTKVVTACAAGTAGCVAIGVLPVPFAHEAPSAGPAIERTAEASQVPAGKNVGLGSRQARNDRKRSEAKRRAEPEDPPEPTSPPIESEAPEPVEFEPAPVQPAPESESSGGSAAGEFGP
jgi:RNA polymerase sigma factor (sigma-70 family)